MAENTFLKVLYTVFLGILIATFIGVGINTFYEGPKEPTTSVIDEVMKSNGQLSDESKAKLEAQQAANEQFMEKNKLYNQNVSIILLVAAVLLVAVSIFIEAHSKVFSDGIMLGGLIALIHSIIRGMIAENKMYLFIATTIGLCVVAYLGYHRFVRRKSLPVEAKS